MYKYKKSISKLLIVILLLPAVYFSSPKKAEAQWIVTDVITHLKTFVLDTLATNIAKTIIKQLTAQTVNWINSGFKGNPAFITDPGQFFLNVGDQQAADFLSNSPHGVLNNLCTPFQAQIRLALAKNYLQETSGQNFKCTLGKIEQNFNNFTQNFDNGGWEGWFSMTQNSLNNPYGAYNIGKDELKLKIATKNKNYSDQLNRAKGFLDFEVCKKGSPVVGSITADAESGSITSGTKKLICKAGYIPFGEPNAGACKAALVEVTVDSNGNEITAEQIDSGIGEGDCIEKETVTPGSVISGKLEGVLGTDLKQLELVQSINQVVSALITQLTQQIVGGVGRGLRGLTQSSPSNTNSRSFIQNLTADTPTQSQQDEDSKKLQESIDAQKVPSISLIGDNPINVVIETPFEDPGVVAADLVDGNISANVIAVPPISTINTSVLGQYIISYHVVNSVGISSKTVTRTVNIIKSPVPEVNVKIEQSNNNGNNN